MAFDPEKILVPSTGVDLVFNANGLTPHSRSSIIYDIDYNTRKAIIAQPHAPITKNTRFKDLHITATCRYQNRRIRIGLPCLALKIIDRYQLANKATTSAVEIKFELPAVEINVRSAYRLTLNARYVIKGKLIFDGRDFHTPADFSIRDVSLNGLGLLVPKMRAKTPNPLAGAEKGTKVMVGLLLIDTEKSAPVATLPLKTEIIRVNKNHSDTHLSIGLQILAINRQQENELNQFIHRAQVEELKRLSGRDS